MQLTLLLVVYWQREGEKGANPNFHRRTKITFARGSYDEVPNILNSEPSHCVISESKSFGSSLLQYSCRVCWRGLNNCCRHPISDHWKHASFLGGFTKTRTTATKDSLFRAHKLSRLPQVLPVCGKYQDWLLPDPAEFLGVNQSQGVSSPHEGHALTRPLLGAVIPICEL